MWVCRVCGSRIKREIFCEIEKDKTIKNIEERFSCTRRFCGRYIDAKDSDNLEILAKWED